MHFFPWLLNRNNGFDKSNFKSKSTGERGYRENNELLN